MSMESNWLNRKLHLEYQGDVNDIWLQKSITLRRLIGILGMLLPLLLWLFLWTHTGQREELDSISHYYFTRVDGIFTITISLMAIFLIVYKGKESIDFYLSFVAGISALVVVLFPTSPLIQQFPDAHFPHVNTILSPDEGRVMIHYIAAGIFLLILAFMSIFLFTKSDKPKDKRGIRKIWRNRVYRICGTGMICSMVVIGLGGLKVIDPDYYELNNLTFWMETVAVELFGISWLIKGETVMQDLK